MVSQYLAENGRGNSETIDLLGFNFNIAFGVRDTNSKAPRHDPDYVEFVPFMEEINMQGIIVSSTPLGFSKCSKEQYAKFSPVVDS
jgi:hypothetical protein